MNFNDIDIEQLIDEIENTIANIELTQELYTEQINQNKHVFEVEIDSLHSFMIVFASDFHFGSIYTDYKKLLEVWNYILKTENCYLIINGDFIDNFDLNHPKLLQAGINSQIITPMLQRDLFIKFLQALVSKKKLLACVLGNHELFSHQYPYFQLIKNIPISSNRMLLKIKTILVEYKIALVHKSRFNSYLNPLHSCYREMTILYPDADVIVTSHTHMPALAVFPYPWNGEFRERIFLKTGSLKNDTYTTASFSPYNINTDYSLPSVIFQGHKRKMTPFLDFKDAKKFFSFSKI